MNKFNFRYLLICIFAGLLVFVTSCGCGGSSVATYSTVSAELKETQMSETEKRVTDALASKGLEESKVLEAKGKVRTLFDGENMDDVLTTTLAYSYEGDELTSKVSELSSSIIDALKLTAKSQLSSFYNTDKMKRHQIALCENQKEETAILLDACTVASTKDIDTKKEVVDSTNIYQVMSNYYIKINTLKSQQGPIRVYSFKEDGFLSALFNNVLVFPIGWLLHAISKLLGGYYFLGIIVITLLIRTIMVPVYNSTNDMTLKQQLMQPDMQKLEAKYANRNDPDSQRAKQMEQAQLYRKYKMGLGGCLPMLFQLPVFIAVYNAVSRMIYTNGTVLNSPDWVSDIKTKAFGVDLFLTRGAVNTWQFWGIMIILVLVVGTQIFQQIMTKKIQKMTYAKSQEDIPAYKRKAYQQDQTGGSMKFMMYFMIAMMGFFVFQSAGALGFYWLIGNIYSLVQMFVNYKLSPRKLAKLKKKLQIED